MRKDKNYARICYIIISSLSLLLYSACSNVNLSEKISIPKNVEFKHSLLLPFNPVKIQHCNYSNTFLLLGKNKDEIYRIDQTGKIIQRIGEFGFSENQFANIADFSIDSSGNIFIVDNVINKIVKFDKEGEYISSISYDEIQIPSLINIKDNGDMLIYDSSQNEVLCYSFNNNLRYRFGKFDFLEPVSLVSTLNSNYILDEGNNYITVFDDFGGIISEIKPEQKTTNICANKYFLFYLDNKLNIYIYKTNLNFLFFNLISKKQIYNPSSLICYKNILGIQQRNKLHLFHLTN